MVKVDKIVDIDIAYVHTERMLILEYHALSQNVAINPGRGKPALFWFHPTLGTRDLKSNQYFPVKDAREIRGIRLGSAGPSPGLQ